MYEDLRSLYAAFISASVADEASTRERDVTGTPSAPDGCAPLVMISLEVPGSLMALADLVEPSSRVRRAMPPDMDGIVFQGLAGMLRPGRTTLRHPDIRSEKKNGIWKGV